MSGGRLAVVACYLVTILTLFSCLHLAIAGNKPVAVSVYPSAIIVGGELRLRCRVEPHADNRRIEYGIQNVANSQRDLDGENAPITWQPRNYTHIPCEAGAAYCAVYRVNKGWLEDVRPFTIGGCD